MRLVRPRLCTRVLTNQIIILTQPAQNRILAKKLCAGYPTPARYTFHRADRTAQTDTPLFMFIAALALAQAVAGFSPQPFVWPAPSSMSQGSETASVSPSLPFFKMSSGSAPKTLQGAFDRYEKLSFPHATGKKGSRGSTAGAISSLSVSVSDVDESHPTIDTDESYTLKIAADEASLSAATVYGAMRGLETFSQLVQFNFDTEEYYVPRAPISVQDSPRFPHRGLMIDSARHFETLDSIRAIIDSLVYAKLNVLHWHMVDSQSFPFQSKTQPKLWDGAYSEYEKYTQDDIALIVEYARERGVRVIVEFDMPGHAASWCTGYPEICPSSTCQQPLNVANNFTFKLIDDLLGECTGGRASSKGSPSGLFPDNFIHLGGDEVDTSCWTKTPAVAKWLADRNMTGDDGYAFFVKNTAAIAIAQGRRPVQWSEVYDVSIMR